MTGGLLGQATDQRRRRSCLLVGWLVGRLCFLLFGGGFVGLLGLFACVCV